jgi:methionyl-tRNA formyltransferase
MVRIVFMGTPEFAVPSLNKLIQTQDVVGVVTQPDRPAGRGRKVTPPPVKGVAEAAGIPVYQPKSLRSEEAAGPLRAWAPELIVVTAFGQLLRPHVLALPAHGCLNVHASLLPRWRGAAPIQHAILAGDSQTGISLMRMDEGLDTGPVYAQQAIPINADDTAATLHDRLADLGAELLGRHVDEIVTGRLTAQPQDDSEATYAPLIKKQDGAIDWRRPAAEIDRQIRAMTPWPGAYSSWQGKRLKILAATLVIGASPADGQPGQVVETAGGAAVVTGQGAIQLDRLQLAGKIATTIEEFLRGRPTFAEARLSLVPTV